MSNHGTCLPALLSSPSEVAGAVQRLAGCKRLWLDTEIADSWSTDRRRLSIIQALPDNVPIGLNNVVLLDVLDQPALIDLFIGTVMKNAAIEKVFHNKSFDVSYLGGQHATTVRCTLQMARSLRKSASVAGSACLPEKNSLQALAEHFGLAPAVSKAEQNSNWARRPLSRQQVLYAARDVIYLRGIDRCLSVLGSGEQNWRADAVVRSISSLHAQYDFESTSPSFSPPSAKSHAFQLLQRGASIDDVVAATERTKSTVIGYLCEFIVQEKITDPGKWLSVDPNVSRRVRAAVGVVGSDKLKPIYEALNEEVSYDTIRVVLACLQRK